LPEPLESSKIQAMNDQVDLAIIIVSWNCRKYLKSCLKSIFQSKKDSSVEIFVVDNNSSDGTVEMVKKEFPKVQLIANNFNAGFAKANNQALKIAKGKYLLLLNPDTEVKADTLTKAVAYLNDHPKAGIMGCKILNPNGSLQNSVRRFPNLSSQILILLKFHNFFPDLEPLKKYFAKDFNYHKEQEADQIMGAFFMIRKECLDEIGLFDEKFWLWFEEVDFCKRVKDKGWKVLYTPELEIIHAQGKSFAQIKAVKEQIIFNRSLLYYFRKHFSPIEYLILLLFYPLNLFLALIVEILESLSLNPKQSN